MRPCIALLRAVNVGGRNLVAMPELCRLFEELGFTGAKSLLHSGNIVFDAGARPTSRIESLLEAETAQRLKVRVDGKQASVAYPDGIGRSKLTTALIEAKLGTRGTGRNWNTVLKLLELC